MLIGTSPPFWHLKDLLENVVTLLLILEITLVGLFDDEVDEFHYLDRIVAVLTVGDLEVYFSVGNGYNIEFHPRGIVCVRNDLLEVDVRGFYFGLGKLFSQELQNTDGFSVN